MEGLDTRQLQVMASIADKFAAALRPYGWIKEKSVNIDGIRFEIEDEVDAPHPTYKVKDLVSFLLTLDQESGVIWSGKEKKKLILTRPKHGTLLYITESTN